MLTFHFLSRSHIIVNIKMYSDNYMMQLESGTVVKGCNFNRAKTALNLCIYLYKDCLRLIG